MPIPETLEAEIPPQGVLRIDYGTKVDDGLNPQPAFVNPSTAWLERSG